MVSGGTYPTCFEISPSPGIIWKAVPGTLAQSMAIPLSRPGTQSQTIPFTTVLGKMQPTWTCFSVRTKWRLKWSQFFTRVTCRGTAIEREKGPPLPSDFPLQHTDKNVPLPTVIMTGPNGKVFIDVKEISSYPSILYSIWTVGKANGTSIELQHLFHIATTIRLAEAVVTGIVHGETSGGGCFGLLRKFNENRDFNNNEPNAERAYIFNERSDRDIKVHLEDTEIITCGLATHASGIVCFACIVVLASIGVVSSICLHSVIDMDIYNSDELIRAAVVSTTHPLGQWRRPTLDDRWHV